MHSFTSVYMLVRSEQTMALAFKLAAKERDLKMICKLKKKLETALGTHGTA